LRDRFCLLLCLPAIIHPHVEAITCRGDHAT
jgi:hypothetical protein